MTQTETHKLNGRSLETQVIQNATDKKLDVEVYDHQYGVLLVDPETGDIYFKKNKDNNFFGV